jgi:hypothetical protein
MSVAKYRDRSLYLPLLPTMRLCAIDRKAVTVRV